jgi:hypothetical protein
MLGIIVVLGLACSTNVAVNHRAAAREMVQGTWRFVKYEVWNDGVVTEPLGTAPSGYIVFDAGRALIQLMRPEQASTLGAYYGTYTADVAARTINIAVEGGNLPGYIGSAQVRPFEIRGDTLVLGVRGDYLATLVRVRTP